MTIRRISSRLKIAASTFIILALFTSACQADDRTADPSPNPTLENTATQTLVPAPSATSTPTLEPTQTATSTPEPSSTPTPTLVPTLPVEAAYSRFLELMETNGGCEIPCWWGITPGKSTLLDLWDKLVPLSSISDTKLLSIVEAGAFFIPYPADDLKIDTYLEFYPVRNTNTIEYIYVSTQALWEYEEGNFESVYDAAPYHKIFQYYSLTNVLLTFGIPSEVKIYADTYLPPSPEQLQVTLYYPERGFLIRYLMNGERIGGFFVGNPSNAFFNLWLFSPEASNHYLLLESLREDLITDIAHGKSLEEAFQMTLDEFYQAFKEPSGLLLKTPLDIWPIY